MLAEKYAQVQLSATQSVSILADETQDFLRSVFLEHAAISDHEEYDSLQDSPLAGCRCGQGGDGREKTTSHHHTYFDCEAIVKIRNILQGQVGLLVGTTRSVVLGLVAADLTFAAVFSCIY